MDENPVRKFIYNFYFERLTAGWTLEQIDKTDMIKWLRILVWKTNRDFMSELLYLDTQTHY